MKQYVMLFIVLFCSFTIASAQTQKQISYSMEKGWDASDFTLQKTYKVDLNAPVQALQQESISKLKRMADDLMLVEVNEKTNEVTITLAIEKRPDWTAGNWFTYLQRRNAIAK